MSLPEHIQHEVEIPYSGGVLGGVLLTPSFSGRHPAIVLLPGSGVADRDVPYILPVREHLVDHGIATLVFDKPGLGGSSGDWRHQTFYDRVEQSRAAIKFLQTRSDINPRQVGLYSISQGAWITLLAAATYPDIRFIIPVSAPAMMPVDQDLYYVEHMMRADGFSEQQIQRALQYVKDVLGAAYHDATYDAIATRFVEPVQNEPWYHYYAIPDADMWEYFRRNAQLHYNPLEWLRQVKCPVLAIFGASDLLFPVDSSVELFRQSLAQAGNQDVSIKVFPNSGHLITNPANGELAPGFLELITDWLKQRMNILQTGYD